MTKFILYILLFCSTFCTGVDKSKFRECENTAFCKRQRDQTDGDKLAKYVLKKDSVLLSSTELTANLQLLDERYDEDPEPLRLTLSLLTNNAIRLQLTEINGLHPRYQVENVLLKEALAPNSHTKDFQTTDTRLTSVFGAKDEYMLNVQLEPEPLKIDLFYEGQPVVTINSENLLKFETYREKNPVIERKEEPPEIEGSDDAAEPNIEGEVKEGEASDGGDSSGSGEDDSLDTSASTSESGSPDESDSTADGDSATETDSDTASTGDNVDAPSEPVTSGEAESEGDPEFFPEDIPGMWEEVFGSHTDKKKYGPSSFGVDISFFNSKHLFGIPEHASSFSLKNTKGEDTYDEPFRLYNLDVFEYDLDVPMALYGAIPYITSITKHASVGLLWLNAAETYVDIYETGNRKTSHWMSESGMMELFIFVGASPADVSYQYGALTGFATLPQYFAISYHQCRWNYKDEDDVSTVDGRFDEYDIPYDVLWLDIEHTDSKKYFTWDSHHFPSPKDMQLKIGAKGRKMVTIIDPHIKRDASYHVHKDAESKGIYVKNADGGDYEGWCWPGSVSYLDFFSDAVKQYWASLFEFHTYEGSTPYLYTWNDMNEPSVFNGPEVSMPKDCVHVGKWEHRDVHNLYGKEVHQATYEGHLLRSKNSDRPFVLSRSFYAGSQRYGPIWTGDNMANWDHLAATVPMLLSLSIAGMPFVGADVGGFFNDPEEELLVRWYQQAAYQPFFRGHAHIDTKRREPWVFGEPHTSNIRAAIRSRYVLLPYVYTLFYHASVDGKPVMRPLWYEYPRDVEGYSIEDEFLLGADLLIKPVVKAHETSSEVYFPGDQAWYDIVTYEAFTPSVRHVVEAPIEKIPVFQRGGSIIPRKERVRRASSLMKNDPFTLVIAVDSTGYAEGSLYSDDGSTFDYQKGEFLLRKFVFKDSALRSSSVGDGKLSSEVTIERVVLLGVHKAVKNVVLRVDGSAEVERLYFTQSDSLIVIKKPNVSVANDFELKVEM